MPETEKIAVPTGMSGQIVIIAPSYMPKRLFRIVRSKVPNTEDVVPAAVIRSRTSAPDIYETLEERAMAHGLSVFDTRAAAIARAKQRTGLIGTYIAIVPMPIPNVVASLTAAGGHWTLWGEFDSILRSMRNIESIQGL